VLTRDALLGRLAALVPPPRANLVRFHGALAPASKLRKDLVPGWHTAEGPSDVAKRPRNDRLDWAHLLQRVYKTDVLTCGVCGGKARPLAVIREPEVVRAILRHLGLPDRPPSIAPVRLLEQPSLPFGPRLPTAAANELDLPEGEVDLARLPAWMRRPEPRPRGRSRRWDTGDGEMPDVARLPAWMRAASPGQPEAMGRAFDDVDEELDVSRLPAWMRSPRAEAQRRPHWHRRRRPPRTASPEDGVVNLALLPAWMRQGSPGGPAPPRATAVDWDQVDPPSPDGFVDPQYRDEAYFN
jgi:hypothetical protein